jgi:hypothetical protein
MAVAPPSPRWPKPSWPVGSIFFCYLDDDFFKSANDGRIASRTGLTDLTGPDGRNGKRLLERSPSDPTGPEPGSLRAVNPHKRGKKH